MTSYQSLAEVILQGEGDTLDLSEDDSSLEGDCSIHAYLDWPYVNLEHWISCPQQSILLKFRLSIFLRFL